MGVQKKLRVRGMTDKDIGVLVMGFDFYHAPLGDPHNADAYALYKAAWADPAIRQRAREVQAKRKRTKPIWAVQRFGDPDTNTPPVPVPAGTVIVKYLRYTPAERVTYDDSREDLFLNGGRADQMRRVTDEEAELLTASGAAVTVADSEATAHIRYYGGDD